MTTLITESQWSHIRQKAALPQFAPALQLLRDEVADFLARPVDVPQLPGGYYHDYFCPQHAVQLVFEPDSPRLHRCPVDGAAYSGEPFDSAWRWSVNNRLAESALRLAVLWKLEDEVGHRQRVQEILLDYAANYASYMTSAGRPANHGIAQFSTLDEAVWVIPLAWSFDIVRPTLSQSQQDEIVDKLLLPAAAFLTRRHFGGIHNFACWHNAAIGTVGAVTGNEELLAFAIDGPHGFHAQSREGILADGLWFEGSFSYHFYTVAALLSLAKATANLPRWDLRRERALSAVLRAPVLCAYPDGSLPATNDCWYFTSLNDDCCHGVPKAPAFYEIGYAWSADPLFGQVLDRAYRRGPRESLDALLFGASSLKEDRSPEPTSVNMEGSGYAILRSQPESQEHASPSSEQYALLKYGAHGGGHGHPDKLSLNLYAQGSRQAPDLGTPGYGIDLFQGWYRQTISHNTVLLDGLSQPPVTGVCTEFSPDGPFQVADATVAWGANPAPSRDIPLDNVRRDALDAYAHVTMRRVVLARADYLVDIFLVVAGEERRVDWIYRNAGDLHAVAESRPALPSALEGEGYEYITDLRSFTLDGDSRLTWRSEGSSMRLFSAEPSGATLYAGRAPGNPAEERHGLLIRRRTAPQTAFLSVLHPFGDTPRLASVTWHARDLLDTGYALCSVDRADGMDLWIILLRPDVEVPPRLAGLPADNRFEYRLEN